MPEKIRNNTSEEEAEINRGIALDPDSRVLSDAEWARAKPAEEIDPELVRSGGGRSGSGAKQLHVLPRKEGWAVRRIGARASEVFATKAAAVKRARELAGASQLEWVEYRRDGTVREIHRLTRQASRQG